MFDNIFILHDSVQVGQGLHVVLGIAKVHIKLVGLPGVGMGVCVCSGGGRGKRGEKSLRINENTNVHCM